MTGSLLKSGLTLAAIAAICTAAVATTYQLTRDRIAANEQALLEESLEPALSGVVFDSSITESMLRLSAPHGLPGKEDAIIYRVYAEGAPAAALFAVTARDGYSGPIRCADPRASGNARARRQDRVNAERLGLPVRRSIDRRSGH